MKDDFRIGEIVVHKREGISKIVSISLMSEKEYFVLNASRGDGELIYVPIEMYSSVMRKLLTQNEADNLLNEMKSFEIVCITNAKQRRDFYKKLLSSGDIKDISLLSYQYMAYENSYKHLEDPQMHLGALDIDMLKSAFSMFIDEMAIIYNKDEEAAIDFIRQKLQK